MHGRENGLFHARKPLYTLVFQACSWKMEDNFYFFQRIINILYRTLVSSMVHFIHSGGYFIKFLHIFLLVSKVFLIFALSYLIKRKLRPKRMG